jgi:hypothetical protein
MTPPYRPPHFTELGMEERLDQFLTRMGGTAMEHHGEMALAFSEARLTELRLA